jgi:hypothetical protein
MSKTSSRSPLTSKKHVEFAVCVENEGYDDLEVWKIYQVLRDAKAAEVGCTRIIDESGEDYLYPADRFVVVDLPKGVRARLPRWQPSNGPHKALRATAKSKRRLSA